MGRVQCQTPEHAARNDTLFRVLLAATNLSAQCNRATAATVAASSPADAGQAVLPRRAPWGPRSIPKSYDPCCVRRWGRDTLRTSLPAIAPTVAVAWHRRKAQ